MTTHDEQDPYSQERAQWDEIKTKYGDFEYIDDPAGVEGIDEKRIWTEFWRSDQFIVNTYKKVDEFDSEVTAYYIFDKPYVEEDSTITLITTAWEDCECEGEDEECEECEGSGTIAIEIA